MSKDRRTVTLDPEVDDYLDREGVNASELVNKLVRNHMTAGGDDEAILQLRKQQIQSEIQELANRKETKKQEFEQVESKLSELSDDRGDVFDDAVDALTPSDLRAENHKVEWWANEANVTIDRLIQEVQDRIQ